MTRITRRRGFSIIELLVVIGVIGLLISLLAPALSGVQKRSRKSGELNHLRTVGQAWTMYATNNNDAALPGYIPEDVQVKWRMNPLFSDRTAMPPEVAAPWTWRLMPFFDNSADVVHGYTDHEDSLLDLQQEALEAAETPAFGYNGTYIGGSFELVTFTDDDGVTSERALPKYWNASRDGRSYEVVLRTLTQMQRPSRLIVFCSSGLRDPGVYKAALPTDEGSHFVDAPRMANVWHWGRERPGGGGGSGGGGGGGGGGLANPSTAVGTGDIFAIEAFRVAHIPIGRHTGQIAILRGDMSVDSQSPGAIVDQSLFINVATEPDWWHLP